MPSFCNERHPQREPLHGGMEEGFRIFASRALFEPGRYRVRVVSEDGREIGRRVFRFEIGQAPRTRSGVDAPEPEGD